MIIEINGEKVTVDTTLNDIEVLNYFYPADFEKDGVIIEDKELCDKAKETVEKIVKQDLPKRNFSDIMSIFFQTEDEPITESQFVIDELARGSMRDKGLELIEKARDVQLTNSTRHKSKEGETHYDPLRVWSDRLVRRQIDSEFLKEDFSKIGKKETENKPDYSEINFNILDLMAERFKANKDKYPKGNSKKPLDKQEILWAMFRHIKKMLQPKENDPETFEDHLSAVLTNCSIVLDQLELKK